MSVLPFAASLPTAVPGEGLATEGAPGAATGFMEALAAALAIAPPSVPTAQPVPASGGAPAAAPAGAPISGPNLPDPVTRGLGPAPAGLPAEALPAPLPGGTTPGAASATGAPGTAPVPAVATAAGGAAAGPFDTAAPAGAGLPPTPGPALPTEVATGAAFAGGRPGVVPTPGAGAAPTTLLDGRPAADLPAELRPAEPTEPAEPAAPAGSPPLAGAEVTLGGVESPQRIAENPHSAVKAAVVQQVFPEVTRLTTGGNGTHRITINLQPEQLGEVRVTLVVRDGAVTVSLGGEAGNSSVQQALSSGAPELRRMLELAGATETRIFVRDAQAMATGTSSQPQSQHDQPAQGDWSRGGHRDEPAPRDHRQQAGRESAQGGAAGVVPTPGLRPPTPGRLDRTI